MKLLNACTALLLLAQVLAPARVTSAQSGGSCDDLAQQIASTGRDLDQLQIDAAPWLLIAGQFGAIAPSDLVVVAQQGIPGLTPGLAGSYGAIAAQLGALIDSWRSSNDGTPSDSYWRDLASNLSSWDSTFASLAPVQGTVASLIGMSTALSQLDQLSSRAQADLGLADSLNSALQDCQAKSGAGNAGGGPSPGPPAGGPATPQALCAVGGEQGYSNSECFRLELDAATAVWTACTEAYFAAERAAFVNGGDLPVNTCDGALKAQTDALQQQYGAPPTP